jgi:hypothetical protein
MTDQDLMRHVDPREMILMAAGRSGLLQGIGELLFFLSKQPSPCAYLRGLEMIDPNKLILKAAAKAGLTHAVAQLLFNSAKYDEYDKTEFSVFSEFGAEQVMFKHLVAAFEDLLDLPLQVADAVFEKGCHMGTVDPGGPDANAFLEYVDRCKGTFSKLVSQ